ncbi:outer membrane beta-barrel family protein [Sediminicola luteus]|uniref:TonB-dependent receptor n=1 Tax=Sediminicola luteus TaxID=319238 RepID=A0A2A4G722_9FLAO|nr:outer membrane beta-barrel family protein [Sediminicola luteus]PCE63542.1 TonB-dependent receptor [Sediminicola luteus]
MKKVILLFALAMGTLYPAKATTDPDPSEVKIGTVSGKVLDNNQQPMAFAAIVIKQASDQSTVTGGISGEDGAFEIKGIPAGNFIFEVQTIGFKTYSKPLRISRQQRKVNMGTIVLEEDAEQLAEVEVVGERTTVEQRVDRKVINVGKDLTTAGATASDIMNNLPSVNVDQQTGQLTLRGNSNVRVMVDGKLSNVPVAQLLRQIPSTSIKSIELITNPSAKYNPEGMSGIVNIVLHKNANIGFNGNINMGLTYQEEAKFNTSVDLNYRTGKFNLYGNYGTNIGKYVNGGWVKRFDDNSIELFDFRNNNKSHLYKVGVDVYLNDKNTVSFFTNQNYYDGIGNGNTDVVYNNDPTRNTTQVFRNENENHSQQYNFDYKLDFEKEGHNIELEVDYNLFNSDEVADFDNSGNTIIPDYTDFVDTERDQLIANLDYVNPIDSISKLELGLEARVFETQVDYESTGLSLNEEGGLVPTPSNDFVYGMDIYSAYATFGQKYDKWSYQAGLRVEDVTVKADTNQVRSFTDEYFEFYPSAFITYEASEKDQLQMSYSRRVDRPGLTQVNPIREWSTPRISSLGNPELLPQFTNSVELNYTRRLKKGSITTGVFYRRISDEINRAIYVDRLDLNRQILTFDNFDQTDAYGAEMSLNYKPLKWWSINSSFDIFAQSNRGITESVDPNLSNPTEDDIERFEVEVDNVAWNLRMNNSFTATKKLTFQLFAFYRGANKNVQFDADPMFFINTGARYSFAEGKGTLSLNFNDILNTMHFGFEGDTPYSQKGRFDWESRTVYLGASYRFGSGKYRAKSRKRRDDNTKQGSGGII